MIGTTPTPSGAEGPTPAESPSEGRGFSNEIATSLATATCIHPIDAAQHRTGGTTSHRVTRHWLDTLTTINDGAGTEHQAEPHCERRPTTADSFIALLADRRSALTQGAGTSDFARTSLHLLGSARAIDLDDAGRIWQSRAHPSAGGTHCLEPLLFAHTVTGLQRGWYRQEGSQLDHIGRVHLTPASRLSQALTDALRRDTAPAAAIYAIADPELMHCRYPEGSSLLWRDTGAFLMTAHLIATSFGLSSTIVGLCTPIQDGTNPEQLQPYAVGALAIGGPLHAHKQPNPADTSADIAAHPHAADTQDMGK